jgi:DNA-binding NtrC family response regulator
LLDLRGAARQVSPHTKLILIPALGGKEPAAVAKRLNGIDYIAGPFDLYEIVSAVERAVKERKDATAGKENKANAAAVQGRKS